MPKYDRYDDVSVLIRYDELAMCIERPWDIVVPGIRYYSK